ncbi:MAG: hypothetical protein AAB416_04740 [Patescibacteria group bacterium]
MEEGDEETMNADHVTEANQFVRDKLRVAGIEISDCVIDTIPDMTGSMENAVKVVAVRKSDGQRVAESFPFRRLVTDSLF